MEQIDIVFVYLAWGLYLVLCGVSSGHHVFDFPELRVVPIDS